MDKTDVWPLFSKFNKKYFDGKLSRVKLSWSPKMTLCAGNTAYRVRRSTGASSCSIRLSQPILSQRPHSDTVNTLLHEMIHAYLHVTQGLNYRDSHGPEFKKHMKRINSEEGTRITIFHNFRKEVDKYRIHVYKCDGPCVSRRPFFGILRRAIKRPPGPTDKWWARHEKECGGTFRKIEGSGATTTTSTVSDLSSKTGQCVSKFSSNSLNKSGTVLKMNKEVSNNIKMSGKKPMDRKMHQRIHINSDKIRKGQNLNEEELVKRIRDKYANTKHSVLLSKEDTEQLNALSISRYQESKDKQSVPYSVNGRMKSHATPFGNYVEGNVNYYYKPHSPSINVAKYLNRYRASKTSLSHSVAGNSGICTSDSFRMTGKSTENVKELEPYTDSQKKDNKMPFNYSYVSKTPGMIKLDKYIERYRVAVSGRSKAETSVKSGKQDSKCVQIVTLSNRQSNTEQNRPGHSGASKTTVCLICDKQIANYKYDQHVKICCPIDSDSDVEMLDENPSKSVQTKVLKSSKIPLGRLSESMHDKDMLSKNCPNCGSAVLVAEMRLHLKYCTESDDDSDVVYIDKKSVGAIKKQQCNNDSMKKCVDVGIVSCPSCSKMVKEDKLQEHLDECLQFFSEDF